MISGRGAIPHRRYTAEIFGRKAREQARFTACRFGEIPKPTVQSGGEKSLYLAFMLN